RQGPEAVPQHRAEAQEDRARPYREARKRARLERARRARAPARTIDRRRDRRRDDLARSLRCRYGGARSSSPARDDEDEEEARERAARSRVAGRVGQRSVTHQLRSAHAEAWWVTPSANPPYRPLLPSRGKAPVNSLIASSTGC